MRELVYLDNNATTKCLPSVAQAAARCFGEMFANPSSSYSLGKDVKKELTRARKIVAQVLNAQKDEIIFTSGGSESNSTAINGLLKRAGDRKRIVCLRVEHASILEQMKALERAGYEVAWLGVDKLGRIDLTQAKKLIDQRTALVVVMAANNEVGNIYPIKAIARLAHQKGAFMHCDGVQAMGKLKVDVKELGVDTLSISAHKFYAPKGVGALYVSGGKLEPYIFGHQERNMRGGTENVAGIIGMGVAAQEILSSGLDYVSEVASLRDQMEQKVQSTMPDVVIYGDRASRTCNTSCMGFRGVDAQELMFMLERDGIIVSIGSACNSELAEPSHVLVAMHADLENYPPLRVSLSRFTTKDEIDYFVEKLAQNVEKLRRKK